MKKGILKAAIEANGEKIKEMYASGMSLRDIAVEVIGRSHPNAIKKYLCSQGVQLRSRLEGFMLKVNTFQDKRRAKLVGKPSGTKGKTWKLKKRKFNPKMSGAGNPMWKGGKTDLQRLIRAMPEYAAWRTAVFQRDDYTCVSCGRRNCVGDKVIIQGDHIYPLSKMLDDYNIKDKDAALKCEALWAIDNGRTMCKECHRKTPTYGCNLNKKAS